jgi:SAM-dependent methyltransferase
MHTRVDDSSTIPIEPPPKVTLKLLPRSSYVGVNEFDPIRYYYWPVLGPMYRRRVELCLSECHPGGRVLEVGFGPGATFINLSEMYDEIHGLDLSTSVEEVTKVFRDLAIDVNLRNGDVLGMPYPDETFDTVLLISILEHLRPHELPAAFAEVKRVLKTGGQAVYGVPVERPITVWVFRLLGHSIRDHHLSPERDVRRAASDALRLERLVQMSGTPAFLGSVYEIGHFVKS